MNGELLLSGITFTKYNVKRSNLNGGSGKGGDLDDSFTSEKQRQSKREKMEMEISRLMEKNNGQIFIVKQEKNGNTREYMKGEDSQGEWSCFEIANDRGTYHSLRGRDRPLFKIKMKPR